MRITTTNQPCQANEVARCLSHARDHAAGRFYADRLDRLEAIHANKRRAEKMVAEYFDWLVKQVTEAPPEAL